MTLQNIKMDILGLSTSPSSGGAYALILSEVDGNRRLPIMIGTFEAQAIALALEDIKPRRPMTHELLKNIILSFDSEIEKVIIYDLMKEHSSPISSARKTGSQSNWMPGRVMRLPWPFVLTPLFSQLPMLLMKRESKQKIRRQRSKMRSVRKIAILN